MLQGDHSSLGSVISADGDSSGRFLASAEVTILLRDLKWASCLCHRAQELRDRSVLITTREPLAAALAAIELDGVARRLVLYPADLQAEHEPYVISSVPVDAVVSDGRFRGGDFSAGPHVACSTRLVPARYDRREVRATEWILLTSGTTGRPKMVQHTLASLAGAIGRSVAPASPIIWSTFYDIRRYGGLQIFLRALLTGASLVLASSKESTEDFLIRAARCGVTHISGTPSHWRKALMSPAARSITPQCVRISGEIADQAILDNLRSIYPQAQVVHAFASTEGGVAFEVRDGLAGFPASFVGEPDAAVELKIENGTLHIRSGRTAECYLGPDAPPLRDAEGFVDTADAVERSGDRYYFVGRRDGVINVGGQKVHPEEVEGVINRHPQVRMSRVRPRKNPLTGALVVADVVLETTVTNGSAKTSEDEILQLCRGALAPYKVPAAIHFVSELPVAGTGKMVRRA